MRRILLGLVIGVLVSAGAVGAAPSGDQTIKGNLTVNGSATIGGDVSARSVVANAANFNDLFAEHTTSAHVTIDAGGNGYDWTDTNGNIIGRLIAGFYPDGIGLNLPGPTLAMRNTGNGTGELWFESAPGAWTKISP